MDVLGFEGQPSLRYTRRYVQDGQPREDQGTIPWPYFLSPPLNMMAGSVYSQPMISPDGLHLRGFMQATPQYEVPIGNSTEYRQDFVEQSVRITLGPVPSASLQTDAPQPHTRSRQWSDPIPTVSNEFVLEYSICDGRRFSGFAREQHSRGNLNQTSLRRSLQGIGWINNQARMVEFTEDMVLNHTYDIVDNRYPVGCHDGFDHSTRYQGSGDREGIRVTTSAIVSADRAQAVQTLPYYYDNNDPGHATRPAYDVINTGVPAWILKPVSRGRALSLIKPLGEQPLDSFYQELDWEAGTHPMKFRSMELNFSSVADISPVGEIFVTSEDGRTFIHEPLPGGIKKFERPDDLLRVLGALWL
jgi:hypothetical protein